jgi:hypothetical protein
MKRSSIFRFLRITTTTLLLIYVLHRADLLSLGGWRNLLSTFSHANLSFVMASLLIGFLLNFSSSVKWFFLARVRNLQVGLWRLFCYYLIGKFFNLILPSSIGGDVIRIHELGRYTGRHADSAAVVFVERFSGLFTLVLLACAAVAINIQTFNLPWLTVSLAFGVGTLGFICWVILDDSLLSLIQKLAGNRRHFLKKVFLKIYKFRHAVLAYQHKPSALLWAFFNSIIFYILAIINVWVSALVFDDGIQLSSILVATPIIMFIMNLPISIGGIGLMEFAYTFILGLFGISSTVAISTALLMRFKTLIEAGIGGLLYYIFGEEEISAQALSNTINESQQERTLVD